MTKTNASTHKASTNTHQHLRAWRRYRKMTLAMVYDEIGSKVNTISGWENGKRGIKLDDLASLAAVYKVSPADLLQSPEAYEQRQAVAQISAIVSRLSPDQIAHYIWMGEAITPSQLQSTGQTDPPHKPTGRDHLPFRVGGNAPRKHMRADCTECARAA